MMGTKTLLFSISVSYEGGAQTSVGAAFERFSPCLVDIEGWV